MVSEFILQCIVFTVGCITNINKRDLASKVIHLTFPRHIFPYLRSLEHVTSRVGMARSG